ncbi:hypothetical protein DFP72DRAFT_855521 [Ephemerocybe angulata]|uniref:Uncharacterized protein n=1 Tax=Ephemerocybe angulata TaxID=980116 RepID=A0A8H6HH61_9AGAR|nr:hypothetical protein DFP72DRAFT_855521 [Tulosesus angulatus]
MSTTTKPLVKVLTNALALKYAKGPSGVDRNIVLALALDGDRTHSAIGAHHTDMVARIASGVREVLEFTPAGSPAMAENFRRDLGEVALNLLKQVAKGDTETLRIRAYLVAELSRVGILDGTAAVGEALGCVFMRSGRAPDVALGICEEIRRRSVGGTRDGFECERGAVAVLEELRVRAGLSYSDVRRG